LNPETAGEEDPFLKRMREDPEFPKEWGASMMSINHGMDLCHANLMMLDFTQYYSKTTTA
jgi:hypothetical protein